MLTDILFDLDGTLVDSYEEISGTIRAAAAKVGFDPVTVPRTLVGFSLKGISEKIYPEMEGSDYQAFESHFRKIYDSSDYLNTHPMSGAAALLQECSSKGFRLHIATMKPTLPTSRILEKLSWHRYFASVTCGDTVRNNKEGKTGILSHALGANSIDASSGCYVGDYPTDIAAANANGLLSIAYLGGYGNIETLRAEGPDREFSSLEDLAFFLCSNVRKRSDDESL